MPHVIVKYYPHRSEEETALMAERVAAALHDTMGFDVANVSVAVEEVEKADWMSVVYERDIAGEGVQLVRRPGYGRLARPVPSPPPAWTDGPPLPTKPKIQPEE